MPRATDDPTNGLSEARIAKIIRDYANADLSVSVIVTRNRIGRARLDALMKLKGIPLRPRPSQQGKPTDGKPRKDSVGTDSALERANHILRKRGCIVYDAEINEGARGRGLIRCDNKRLTRDEIIALAAKGKPTP